MASFISHFLIVTANQALLSCVRLLPSASAVFCNVISAQLCLVPQHIRYRECTFVDGFKPMWLFLWGYFSSLTSHSWPMFSICLAASQRQHVIASLHFHTISYEMCLTFNVTFNFYTVHALKDVSILWQCLYSHSSLFFVSGNHGNCASLLQCIPHIAFCNWLSLIPAVVLVWIFLVRWLFHI